MCQNKANSWFVSLNHQVNRRMGARELSEGNLIGVLKFQRPLLCSHFSRTRIWIKTRQLVEIVCPISQASSNHSTYFKSKIVPPFDAVAPVQTTNETPSSTILRPLTTVTPFGATKSGLTMRTRATAICRIFRRWRWRRRGRWTHSAVVRSRTTLQKHQHVLFAKIMSQCSKES